MTTSSSVLTIAHAAADELNLDVPTSLFAGSTETERKLKRALIKTARFIYRYHEWPFLKRSFEFYPLYNGLQQEGWIWDLVSYRSMPGNWILSPIPNDFGRLCKDYVHVVNKSEMFLPISDRAAYDLADDLNETALFVDRDNLYFTSSNATGDKIRVYYYSINYVEAVDGTFKADINADTDRLPWSDELIESGMIWATLHRDGDHTSEDYMNFVSALNEQITDTSSAEILDFSQRTNSEFSENWPRTAWGQ